MNRPLLTAAVTERVRTARRHIAEGRTDTAWQLLQDAHILSQPLARPHVQVHAEMLRLGWRQRDTRELAGQFVRLMLAGPGSLSGRYPAGNSGRARVSAFKRTEIRPDLASILDSAR
jgi:Protein of unknown function (DUF3703)